MKSSGQTPFDPHQFLDSPGVGKKPQQFRRHETIFTQGDVSDTVMYIQIGGVKLSARSAAGKEVVIAMLGPGDFFGEGCMAGQPLRMGSAIAMTLSSIMVLRKREMLQLLRTQPDLADRFITHMLSTNIRIQEELIDQLFNHDEKRLARTLLRLARYGNASRPERVLGNVSQAKLARMSGATRERVEFFMKKFRRLGFIGTGRPLTVNTSLLTVVLQD